MRIIINNINVLNINVLNINALIEGVRMLAQDPQPGSDVLIRVHDALHVDHHLQPVLGDYLLGVLRGQEGRKAQWKELLFPASWAGGGSPFGEEVLRSMGLAGPDGDSRPKWVVTPSGSWEKGVGRYRSSRTFPRYVVATGVLTHREAAALIPPSNDPTAYHAHRRPLGYDEAWRLADAASRRDGLVPASLAAAWTEFAVGSAPRAEAITAWAKAKTEAWRGGLAATEVWGGGWRLPTGEEWEWVCRAGTTTDTYAGDFADEAGVDSRARNAALQANAAMLGEIAVLGAAADMAPRQLRPNPWGLHDTLGLCREWCADFQEVQARKPGGFLCRGGYSGSWSRELNVTKGRDKKWVERTYVAAAGLRLLRTYSP